MTTSNDREKKIKLEKIISKNLIFRDTANKLFDNIDNFNATIIFIDFNKIQSITRSFAHQYLINKRKSKKNIIDVNISPDVQNMFKLIEKTIKN